MKKDSPVSIAKLTSLSSGVLQEQAMAYLASGSYKLTQEIYKILLKREDNPRYQKGLAECYLKRSLLAAEQHKFKDAITLWGNYIEHAETHAANEQYIRWLLVTGQKAKIKTYLQSLDVEQLEQDYPQLAVALGFFHIGGQIDLLDYLPEHIALVVQTRSAQLALNALQQNDRQLMREHLANIPFRSVYRDFRTLLNAIYLLFESPDQANALLNKIAADSPYQAVARLIRILSLTGKPLTDALLTFGHKQQHVICKAKGWTDQQITLLQYLSRQKQQLTDKAKLEVAIQYQNLLGKDYAQRFCAALLPAYPAGRRVYEKNFRPLDDFEKLRISALHAEEREKFFDALDFWEQCVEILQANPQQNSLQIALILRRMATLCAPAEAVDYQLESLQFDAEDKETQLKILSYYEQQGDKERYKKRLQETLAVFPGDIEVLGLAMQAAVGNKAYKKATQYAEKILAVDPVNSGAIKLLFTSHLNHARKLLKSGKYHLVEKEITQAEKLTPGKHYLALAQMLYGFFIYLSDDKAKGAQLIANSCELSKEGDFASRYRIINEAMLLDIPLTPLLRAIGPLAEDYALSIAELNAFLKLLDEQQKEGNPYVVKALEKVKKDFKRLTKDLPLTQEQLLAVMQRMERIKHFELMRHCLKCVPDITFKPVWVFYKIYIQANGNPAKVIPFDITKLQFQLNNAKDEGDQRTETLIAGFLDKIYRYHHDALAAPAEDDYYDPYEQLFEHIDSRTYAKITRKLEKLHIGLTEEQLLTVLLDMLPDKLQVALLFKDPDAFNALLFLKAAQELGIDINVAVEDILEIARHSTGGGSFSF